MKHSTDFVAIMDKELREINIWPDFEWCFTDEPLGYTKSDDYYTRSVPLTLTEEEIDLQISTGEL